MTSYSPPSPADAANTTLSSAADFSMRDEAGETRVFLSGTLTVHSLKRLEQRLPQALKNSAPKIRFDLARVERLDTAGALFLNRLAERARLRGKDCAIEAANETQKKLLRKSVLPESGPHQGARPDNVFIRVCEYAGHATLDALNIVGELVGFLGKFLSTLAYLCRRPDRMRWTSLIFNMEQVGLRAVPIVGLLTFLIGLVVAYMGAQQLTMFGAQIFAVNLLEVTVLREMAVLITAIVVAGRSSSSFTAQIGAMVANEEVDALRSMGLDPNTLLVVPRVLALIICLPMLVFLADVMALFGGAMALWYVMDMDLAAFLTQLEDVANINNFFVGLIKTPFFAMAIGLVGCFQGFRATGSAESVGFLTTISVVQAIFIVILLDALFAIFFMNIGI